MVREAEVLWQSNPDQLGGAQRQVRIRREIEIDLQSKSDSQAPVVESRVSPNRLRHEALPHPPFQAVRDEVLLNESPHNAVQPACEHREVPLFSERQLRSQFTEPQDGTSECGWPE